MMDQTNKVQKCSGLYDGITPVFACEAMSLTSGKQDLEETVSYFRHNTFYEDKNLVNKYEGRLQSPCTHLITPCRNFVEVR